MTRLVRWMIDLARRILGIRSPSFEIANDPRIRAEIDEYTDYLRAFIEIVDNWPIVDNRNFAPNGNYQKERRGHIRYAPHRFDQRRP